MSSETLLERWLGALANIGEAVGGDEPVVDLLDRVARTACTLLGYDFCAVFLPGDDGRALTIEGSYGLSADYVAQVNANRPILLDVRGEREAPTSLAYRSGEVVTLEDIQLVPDFTWGGVAQEQGYRALISVPLRRSGTVVGALNGYRTAPHRFDRAEITLVTTLATQVAIALGTAQLRAAEQATIRELRRAEEVHTLLMATALRGEGVAGVASALAALLDRAVLIEDVYDEPLADAGWTAAGPSEHTVAAVTLDGTTVARIHIAATDSELSALDVRAVEHATVVTALELLRDRTAAEVEQRIRGSLVADLLASDGADMAAFLDRARRLGWDLSGGHALIAIRPATERTLATADRFVAGTTPRPLAALHRGDLVLVWPEHAGPAVEIAGRLIETLTAARAVEHAVAAVSPPSAASELPASFLTVRGALDLAGDRAGPSVIDLSELTVAHLLLQVDDPRRLRGFAWSVLGRAAEYDRNRSTELLHTARVYLDHGMDRRATAEALHLHPNTVAQRIRRLEELTGLDLSRPADLLQFTAALTVARIAELR
ncbi:GAF domain-containing protein [Mycobacterium sp. 236(2023)]|uniref:helix-turn-helix domain-containing protein n=1 Tax=Mycobacterium sp. 236(2023) TaxID=3038163 RepID=UPI002414FEA7|nr:GAF domain-containing protein [Mycobacterium sp. 236(2023)]MDG4668457.1 helix-turn-helix domain-containing protein [Mycobacterium sp. 236(2023)]